MTTISIGAIAKIDRAELIALLGMPPIISTESADQFQQILERLLRGLNASDMVEIMLIRDFAVADWEGISQD